MLARLLGTSVTGLLLCGWALLAPAQEEKAEAKINFQDNIDAIFRNRCNSCHNTDTAKGGLVLETYGAMMQGGGSGEVIEPGDADNSWLFLLVSHEESPQMPPNSPRIPDEELETLRAWIDAGAPENSGSVVAMPKKNKLDFQLDPSAMGKPAGEPAMPDGLSSEPVIVSDRPNAILAMAASPWAPLVAVAGHKQVLLYHTDNQELLGVLPFPEGAIHVLKFTTDGEMLLAGGGRGGQSGGVVVWDVKTGERLFEVGREYDIVIGADISPDRTKIALGGPSKVFKVYDAIDNEILFEQRKHTEWVTSVAFSPDGVLIASGDRNGGLVVWEADTGREFYDLPGHKGMIADLSWRLDSNVLASASLDASVRLWDMFKGTQIKTWGAHGEGTESIRFSNDGRLVTAGRDRTAKLWTGDGNAVRTFEAFPDLALQADFTHDNAKIIAGAFNGEVRVFDTEDGKKIGELVANPKPIAARLKEARADAAKALAEAEAATKALEPLESALAQANSELTQAQEDLASAETNASNAAKTAEEAEMVSEAMANAEKAATEALNAARKLDSVSVATLSKAAEELAKRAAEVSTAAEKGDAKATENALTARLAAAEAVEKALADLGSSADGLKKALAEASKLKAEAAEAEKALETALVDAKTAADKVQGLKTAVEQAGTKKAEAEKTLAEKQPDVNALKAKADELADKVEALDNEAKTVQAKAEVAADSGD